MYDKSGGNHETPWQTLDENIKDCHHEQKQAGENDEGKVFIMFGSPTLRLCPLCVSDT